MSQQDSIQAQTASRTLNQECDLDNNEKEVSPGPLGGGTIKAQPKIDGLQCSYESSQPAEQSKDQREGDEYLREVDLWREEVEMRKHYLRYEVSLQPRTGPLRHFVHPVAQTTGAVRVISVSGGELPQGLLPPHRADKETGQPIPQVQSRALTWVAAKIDCCNHNTDNDQQPENVARPLSLEFQHVGNWIYSHID